MFEREIPLRFHRKRPLIVTDLRLDLGQG